MNNNTPYEQPKIESSSDVAGLLTFKNHGGGKGGGNHGGGHHS
jgi:hypothetical protein